MRCAFCQHEMAYIHGHAACTHGSCPMFGRNQAECCDGETVGQCPVTTAEVAAITPAAPSSRRRRR